MDFSACRVAPGSAAWSARGALDPSPWGHLRSPVARLHTATVIPLLTFFRNLLSFDLMPSLFLTSFSLSDVVFFLFGERLVFSFQNIFRAGATLFDLNKQIFKSLFSACLSIFSRKNIAFMDKKLGVNFWFPDFCHVLSNSFKLR